MKIYIYPDTDSSSSVDLDTMWDLAEEWQRREDTTDSDLSNGRFRIFNSIDDMDGDHGKSTSSTS